MNLWLPIEELRGAANLDILTASPKDRELQLYLRAAQGFAEKFCTRKLDGSILQTQYIDLDEETDRIILHNTPLVSVASIYNDPGRIFDSTTLVSSSDYIVINSSGIVQLKDSNFLSLLQGGQTSVKASYYGGYISERTIVAAATPANGMTIVNILSYAQPFSIAVQTSGTAVAANVTVVGLDENGVSQTETIAVTAVAGRFQSIYQWTSITTFNAVGILGTGNTVKLVGSSFPDDLRAALLLHVAHLYAQDNDKTLNLTSRSVGQKTESGFGKGVPAEVKELLQGYRRFS